MSGRWPLMRWLTLGMLAIGVSSCGYRFGGGGVMEEGSTLSVPYIEGDRDGRLTSLVIEELNATGAFCYRPSGGKRSLRVKLIDFREENIGFRYDRDGEDHRTRNVIPSETRLTVVAEVSVEDVCKGCVLLGPELISASIEFDHDYYSNHGGVNVFSLGQLNDIDQAQQMVFRPLSRVLASKIAEYLVSG